MAPSSLPANRSTPRSHFLVPLPPSGPSRQTIRTRGAAPGGFTLARSPGDPTVPGLEPRSTTDPRRDPALLRLAVPGGTARTGGARHTVSVPHLSCLHRPSAAAQPGAARTRLVSRPVASGSAREPYRNLPASTPPCLRPTRCPPKRPAWSWSSPNSSRGLHQALDAPPPVRARELFPSVVRRSVRIRFPLPCSA